MANEFLDSYTETQERVVVLRVETRGVGLAAKLLIAEHWQNKVPGALMMPGAGMTIVLKKDLLSTPPENAPRATPPGVRLNRAPTHA